MKWQTSVLFFIAPLLIGCNRAFDLGMKSDVENCVTAQLAAYEAKSPYRETEFRELLKKISQKSVKTATNPQTGERVYLDEKANEWAPIPGHPSEMTLETINKKYALAPPGVTAEQANAYRLAQMKADFYLLCLGAAARK